MSKLYFFIVSLTLAFILNSCSSSSQKNEPNNMVANFEIEGMVCEHGCKGVIEKEMNKTKGISSFDIDFEKATAEVFFDKSIITSEGIINHIEAINDGIYKVKLIKEYKQINARESLPSSTDATKSVSIFNFQIPNIKRFVSEWIKI